MWIRNSHNGSIGATRKISKCEKPMYNCRSENAQVAKFCRNQVFYQYQFARGQLVVASVVAYELSVSIEAKPLDNF